MLIEDIEYVIFQHPDSKRRANSCWIMDCWTWSDGSDSVYLRSYGEAPFSYVTTKGEAAFRWFRFPRSPTATPSRNSRSASIRRLPIARIRAAG